MHPLLSRASGPSFLRVSAGAVLLLACGCSPADRGPANPGGAWPYAVVRADCAPWDGAALSLTLGQLGSTTEPAYPLIHIGVYHPPAEVLDHAFSFNEADTQEGGAMYCEAEGACVSSREVKVRFGRIKPDSTVSGEYRLVLRDGRQEGGTFTARFLTQPALCG